VLCSEPHSTQNSVLDDSAQSKTFEQEMNPLTEDHLANLWERDGATLTERYTQHLDAVRKMDLPTTGVIGRDLLIRRQCLFTPRFYVAAFLATESETGHDGFLDFTDSIAILPADRYDAVTSNPDLLIDDPICRDYAELGFVHAVSKHFDELAGLEEFDDFLDYLVFGSDRDSPWPRMQAEATSTNARQWLPRLFERSGHLLTTPEQDAATRPLSNGPRSSNP